MLPDDAPKWDAAVYLLAALDDRDRDVRRLASQLLGSWVAHYNIQQTPPTPDHQWRIHALLDAHGAELDEDTAAFLRLPFE